MQRQWHHFEPCRLLLHANAIRSQSCSCVFEAVSLSQMLPLRPGNLDAKAEAIALRVVESRGGVDLYSENVYCRVEIQKWMLVY